MNPFLLTAFSTSSLKTQIEHRRTAFAFVLEDKNGVLDFSADLQPFPRPMPGLLEATSRGLTHLPDTAQSISIQVASPRIVRAGSAAGRLVRQSSGTMGRKHSRVWNAIRERLTNRHVAWKLLEMGSSEKLDALVRCCQHMLGFQPIPFPIPNEQSAQSPAIERCPVAKQGALSPCNAVIATPAVLRDIRACADTTIYEEFLDVA
jgi:hypothetical protein